MAVIELVREPLSAKKATVKEAEAATKRAAKQAEAKAAAAETKAAEEEAKATEAEETTAATAAVALELPEGAVAANEDGSAPEGYTVKGNADSGLYHEPDGQWYDQTVAEFWFKSAEDAEAAGFKKAGSGS
jgi:large subunit ribosomal protein L17